MKSEYWTLFRRYLGVQRGRVVLLALLVVIGIGLQLLNPQLVRRFLDAAETGQELDVLVRTAVLFTSIAIVAQGFKVVATYVGELVAWTATNELRADLALHCLRLDMDFHKANKPGELIERVDGDINTLANFFSQLVIQLGSNLLLVFGVIVLLWAVDWRVGASVSLIAAAGLLLLNRLNARLVVRWQALRVTITNLFGYLEEWLGGTAEIQTSGATAYILARLYPLLRERWLRFRRAMQMNFWVMLIPIVLPSLAYIAAYVWGTNLFRNSVLTIGGVYLIFYYIDVIKGPLWVIQRQVQDLQQASASLNRIAALLAERPSIADGTAVLPGGPLAVQFDRVTFAYADDPDTAVLADLSFTLRPGTVLGLLGRTGSGKSTLSRLLFRLYQPTAGAIRLAGADGRFVDVRDVAQSALRTRIGMVTQDVQLFHASVRDNLTLYDHGIDDATIREALHALGLRPWLEALPDGLDTRIEGGDSLSAGEAQLLALARVFLRDPGLVIMDEASARLDPATEQLLERAVARLLAGRTAIIIAHRLATVQRADEIMVLGNGRLLEHDARAVLASRGDSAFAALLRTGGEILVE